MLESVPDNRASAAAAAWVLHMHHLKAGDRGRHALMRRLATWIRRLGEKLARWRLSFSDYPWDRDD
jgi:hypothetical protein